MLACDLNQMVAESASQVLETMFFTCVVGDSPVEPRDPVTTRLDFLGNPSGSFGLSVEPLTARQIAGGFLAEDEQDISQAQVDEVMCELTNMLCGSLLSRIESESHFVLTHPELAPLPDHPSFSHNFELESGILGIWLSLQERP